jgi:hypothetical protein
VTYRSFDYLAIPAAPAPGMRIPQFRCERDIAGYHQILNADTTITVPAGTYPAFSLRLLNGDRSFWNRDIGMIMYERYEPDSTAQLKLLGTYKLNRVE